MGPWYFVIDQERSIHQGRTYWRVRCLAAKRFCFHHSTGSQNLKQHYKSPNPMVLKVLDGG